MSIFTCLASQKFPAPLRATRALPTEQEWVNFRLFVMEIMLQPHNYKLERAFHCHHPSSRIRFTFWWKGQREMERGFHLANCITLLLRLLDWVACIQSYSDSVTIGDPEGANLDVCALTNVCKVPFVVHYETRAMKLVLREFIAPKILDPMKLVCFDSAWLIVSKGRKNNQLNKICFSGIVFNFPTLDAKKSKEQRRHDRHVRDSG